ncbi:unnamed protein product [Umbelopsis sp. WA50703]
MQQEIHQPIAFSNIFNEHADEADDQLSALMPLSNSHHTAIRRTSVSAESIAPSVVTEEGKLNIPKSESQANFIKEALTQIFLFKHLDSDQLHDVVLAMKECHTQAGTCVIKQGDDGDFFYIVQSGRLECYIEKGNHSQLVAIYGPKSSFGEVALMYNSPRSATITATQHCILYALDRSTFRSLLVNNMAHKRVTYETFLNKIPFIQPLPLIERRKIADALEPRYFADKEIVITQGGIGDYFYLIVSGAALVTNSIAKDSDDIILGEGQYFGGMFFNNTTFGHFGVLP